MELTFDKIKSKYFIPIIYDWTDLYDMSDIIVEIFNNGIENIINTCDLSNSNILCIVIKISDENIFI